MLASLLSSSINHEKHYAFITTYISAQCSCDSCPVPHCHRSLIKDTDIFCTERDDTTLMPLQQMDGGGLQCEARTDWPQKLKAIDVNINNHQKKTRLKTLPNVSPQPVIAAVCSLWHSCSGFFMFFAFIFKDQNSQEDLLSKTDSDEKLNWQ